jgi:segregation and condensation protein A
MSAVFEELISVIRPQEEKLEEEKLERKINIEDKILSIQQIVFDKIKINFSKLMEKAESKTEIIVSFLAILELIKQRNIFVDQDDLFGEITINKNN